MRAAEKNMMLKTIGAFVVASINDRACGRAVAA
jgi:hypothetical protein